MQNRSISNEMTYWNGKGKKPAVLFRIPKSVRDQPCYFCRHTVRAGMPTVLLDTTPGYMAHPECAEG